MKVLLDTCVLSEINKERPNKKVISLIQKLPEQDLFISVICVGEITKGVDLLASGRKKNSLKDWLNALEKYYADRILSIDLETVKIWGCITSAAQKQGKIISASDGMIAASAIQHNLRVVTRNLKDFDTTGVSIINPWLN